MSRYIDADKLSEKLDEFKKDVPLVVMAFAQGQINDAPTADVVKVVRCKDCKHLKYGYQCYRPLGINLSNDGDAYVFVDPEKDFCSGAERRGDTE